jgi:hypothetical protein
MKSEEKREGNLIAKLKNMGICGKNYTYEWVLGSSDFDKIFENCFASCSFGTAKDI